MYGMGAVDIASLVKGSLEFIGCDPGLIGDIDSHSPIELTFDGSPNLYIEAMDDAVWMLAYVAECNDEDLYARASNLMRVITQARPWVDGDFVACGYVDNTMIVKGRLASASLQDAEVFALAIGDFYDLVLELHSMMSQ